MIPTHASLPVEHLDAILWDEMQRIETERMKARLAAIREDDDRDAMIGEILSARMESLR